VIFFGALGKSSRNEVEKNAFWRNCGIYDELGAIVNKLNLIKLEI
jgi:hypothetical protein